MSRLHQKNIYLYLANFRYWLISDHCKVLYLYTVGFSWSPSESSIPRHERVQHMWDQRCGIDCFAIRLRVQRGVAVEVGF